VSFLFDVYFLLLFYLWLFIFECKRFERWQCMMMMWFSMRWILINHRICLCSSWNVVVNSLTDWSMCLTHCVCCCQQHQLMVETSLSSAAASSSLFMSTTLNINSNSVYILREWTHITIKKRLCWYLMEINLSLISTTRPCNWVGVVTSHPESKAVKQS